MGKFKNLELEVSDLAVWIADLPLTGLEYLGAVLAENREDVAQTLLVSLEVNLERVRNQND